jgi:pimeloyl-ACP methyl ester carboxylesterase
VLPTDIECRVGSSEFYITGVSQAWTIIDIIHRIAVPTLLINGRYDEAQDEVMEPLFRYIPEVKWVQFAESAHVPQFEEKELFIQVITGFLDY